MKHEPKEEKAATSPALAQQVTLYDERAKRLQEHEAKKEARRVKGKATFIISAPHYRDGVLYPAGTAVTIDGEIPSKTWKKVALDKSAPVLVPPKDPDDVAAEDEEDEDLIPVTTANVYPNPGGVAPSTTNTASTSVTVATTPKEAAEVADTRKPEEQAKDKDKGRPSDKKY